MSPPTLSQISTLPQKDRLPAYNSLLPSLYASPLPDLVDLIDHLINDPSVSLVTGRQVYSEVVSTIKHGDQLSGGPDVAREVIENVLEKVKNGTSASSIANYEEQVSRMSYEVIKLLEEELICVRRDSAGVDVGPSTSTRRDAGSRGGLGGGCKGADGCSSGLVEYVSIRITPATFPSR
jgi:hypothetical protein